MEASNRGPVTAQDTPPAFSSSFSLDRSASRLNPAVFQSKTDFSRMTAMQKSNPRVFFTASRKASTKSNGDRIHTTSCTARGNRRKMSALRIKTFENAHSMAFGSEMLSLKPLHTPLSFNPCFLVCSQKNGLNKRTCHASCTVIISLPDASPPVYKPLVL